MNRGEQTVEEILLRPHHALCVRFFEGKGYSGDFAEHMAATIERLEKPGTYVRLVDKEDEICKKCPNDLGDGCSQREKVQRYDSNVLQMTSVSCEERMEWNRLQELVEQKIMERGRFPDICNDCGWAFICHQNKKKRGGK